VSVMSLDIKHELTDQLDWHWQHHLRPRLAGLTDEEYFWEPVPRSWNLHPRGEGYTEFQGGSGAYTIDFDPSEPSPAPVTTIAWRLGHLLVGVLGARNAQHFGAEPVDYAGYRYPETADAALADLEARYATWMAGIGSLSEADLARPCGEYGFEQHPMAALILHIHREMIHHGAEICLLRDLYAHRSS
jgi:hypothetical protein